MNPSINGTYVRVFKQDVEEHDFRNRPKDKEASYIFVATLKIQAVWFSHEELQHFQNMDRIQSQGYFIFKNSDLKRLDMNPSPEGGDWNRYRFQHNINGIYTGRMVEVVEMRPESPHRGTFKLWYAYFHEIRPESNMEYLESPTEINDTPKEITELVDIVRVYE